MTLATLDASGAPYVAPLYFALGSPPVLPPGPTHAHHPPPTLVFAGSPHSAHGQHLGAGPTLVAAAVAWETTEIGALRGVQLRGAVWRHDRLDEADAAQARADYLSRHPVAAPMLSGGAASVYVLRVQWAKLTDNRLGFGVHPVFTFADRP
jgi:uncharacterized protein YhbP (UPF0306 family)